VYFYIRKILGFLENLKNNPTIRLLRKFLILIYKCIQHKIDNKKLKREKINFIVEKANWAIRWDGIYITNSINKFIAKGISIISTIPLLQSDKKVIHFASQYMWLDWHKLLPKKNKYIVSFFHGKHEDGNNVSKHIDEFIRTKDSIYRVITASSLVKKRLIKWGIPNKKIVLIHTGVDTSLFSIPTQEKRLIARKKLGITNNKLVIGSFQKDGIGWGDGNLPKYIKGPDIFAKAVEIIAKKFPTIVLLTGPSRGYLKNELDKRNIRYKHFFLEDYEEIIHYYHALDLYIVSSREEGGPKSLIESMASGVPVVTTNVGMGQDFIKDKINGGIVNCFDPIVIAEKSLEILKLPKKELIFQARKDVMKADWNVVAKLHWEKAYKPALEELNSI
tara:strand:+ start:87 stop:1256 length:1170 start_codon:yes stop_codon:yes gene_type:complete